MTETERGRDGNNDGDADGDRTAERARSDPRLGTAAFALAVLVASVIPVSWVAPGGAGSGSGAVGALPLDLGLTDPFHLVGYAVLTALASRATGRGRRGLLLAAAGAVAFGFGIELVQAPIPWRSFAWRDAAVNAVGAAIGSVTVVAVGVAVGAINSNASDDASDTTRR